MSIDQQDLNKKKDDKKQVIVKLEWIFGLRKDIIPNIYSLDKDTYVYPASNYVVVYNNGKNVNPNQVQLYIPGQIHSKGIVTIATSNIQKKLISVGEETSDGILISFYTIVGSAYSSIHKMSSFDLVDYRLTKMHAMEFSQRKKLNNYFIAVASGESSTYFALWDWDLEAIRDAPNIYQTKIPKESITMELSFSSASMDNDQFCLVGETYIYFYAIESKSIEETDRISLEIDPDLGSVIYSHGWLFEGSFCFLTDLSIFIVEAKSKRIIQQLENPDGDLRIITPYTISSAFEGFVSGGVNKSLHFYGKTTKNIDDEDQGKTVEEYELLMKKTKFDFLPGLNEKISGEKVQNDKMASNDRERNFDFLSILSFFDEFYIVATTSSNDIIIINTVQKELDRTPVKHLIAPFHCDSIEGMDTAINKPYLLTCSKDKSLRLWDYQKRNLVLSKFFEEELYSVTYHPSGMHALVSTEDKIYPLNVFYDEIDSMTQQITTKAKSKDIKFSHLGNLFAFDSGTFVQIWDFLNMQIFSGPPPYGPQKKSFSTTTSKLNYLSWRDDDHHLLACGYEYIYDWKVREDHDTKQKMIQSNITSCIFCENNSFLVATTEDKKLRKLQENSSNYIIENFDYSMKELVAFQKSKLVACATSKYGQISPDANNPNSQTTAYDYTLTTCLRIFPDIISSNEHIDVPAHYGEITRVRFNYEENKLFTSGEDGCLNVYTIELPFDLDHPDKYINDQNNNYTDTVLIKKLKYKERDFDKKELPAKRDEKLKKNKSEYYDKREADKKKLEDKKNLIATTKYTEMNLINTKKNELQNTEVVYDNRIKQAKQKFDNDYEKQFSENQIELAAKTREVESIRDTIKQNKEQYKQKSEELVKEAKAKRNEKEETFKISKSQLLGHKEELLEKILTLKDNQKKDTNALEWLNSEVLTHIQANTNELSAKIEDLRGHYTHHIKKQKEEKEKLQQTEDNLLLDLKKIEEEKESQEKKKKKNDQNRTIALDEMNKITARISEIENKIIECKKAHTYLEKCKFVLSYKIQELKKEAGPMEKVLEDLQKRTKEDELSLSKYNREFDIIAQKLVDLEDLKEKTKTHERTERDLKNEINNFKIDLFNMLATIDDYDKLREGFRNLREKYLKNYVPEVQDHELEGEFSNQKSKMKNRVFELQENLSTLKVRHKENISENRSENNNMIAKIVDLKKNIKKEKRNKEEKSGNQKHANAVAEIFAGQFVKKIMLEDISIGDKIQMLKEKIEVKKEDLKELRNTEKDNPYFMENDIEQENEDNEQGNVQEIRHGLEVNQDNDNDQDQDDQDNVQLDQDDNNAINNHDANDNNAEGEQEEN